MVHLYSVFTYIHAFYVIVPLIKQRTARIIAGPTIVQIIRSDLVLSINSPDLIIMDIFTRSDNYG